jgi:hypothetical protein
MRPRGTITQAGGDGILEAEEAMTTTDGVVERTRLEA